jgi:hypothetical protein
MPLYEYKVVPAPNKGQKAKGVKTAPARFALAIESALNTLAAEGWEYLRAETLPSEERSGLTSTQVNDRALLIFRRAMPELGQTSPSDTQETDALRDRVAQLMDQPDIAEQQATRDD